MNTVENRRKREIFSVLPMEIQSKSKPYYIVTVSLQTSGTEVVARLDYYHLCGLHRRSSNAVLGPMDEQLLHVRWIQQASNKHDIFLILY